MRNTLITGLLLCLPTAVLLASVSAAVLAALLRRRLGRAPTFTGISVIHAVLVGQVLPVFAQARRRRQRDELFGLGPVIIDWCHREDEPALAEADRLDQDRAAGPGQDDHITRIDVASEDHILHRS
jgi:hypothetical protein